MGGEQIRGDREARWSREDVLRAAETIVDRDGWEALTMTALARDLDVRAPSLYHHLQGLDALRGELRARTLEALVASEAQAATGVVGTEGVWAVANAHRDYALAHPQRYLGLTSGLVDRERLRLSTWDSLDTLLEVVRSSGVPEAQLGSAMEAMFAAHHGAIVLEIGRFFAYADPDVVFDSVVEGSIRTIESLAARPAPLEDRT